MYRSLAGEGGLETLNRNQLGRSQLRHVRAAYTLERGTWYATCRDCSWHTSDPNRRRAAAMFRLHRADVQETIDLTELPLRVLPLTGDEEALDPRSLRGRS
jgi:hypothetical protein